MERWKFGFLNYTISRYNYEIGKALQCMNNNKLNGQYFNATFKKSYQINYTIENNSIIINLIYNLWYKPIHKQSLPYKKISEDALTSPDNK